MFPTTIYDVNVRLAQCHLESRSLFTSLGVRSREIFVRKSYLYRCSTLVAYITTIMYKSLGTDLHLCGFFSIHTCPTPTPTLQTTLDACRRVSRIFPSFSIVQGGGELQKTFEKDAQGVFYKGFRNYKKIMNTASLHQDFCPGVCIRRLLALFLNFILFSQVILRFRANQGAV